MFIVAPPQPKVSLIHKSGSKSEYESLQALINSKPLRWFQERIFKAGQTRRPAYSQFGPSWWQLPAHYHPENGAYKIVTCNDKVIPLDYLEKLAPPQFYSWRSGHGSKRYHYKKSRSRYRRMHTTAERRQQFAFDWDLAEDETDLPWTRWLIARRSFAPDCPAPKGRRRVLQDNYDDVRRRDDSKSWKRHRRTQYRVKDLAQPPYFDKMKIPYRGRFVEYRRRDYEDLSRSCQKVVRP